MRSSVRPKLLSALSGVALITVLTASSASASPGGAATVAEERLPAQVTLPDTSDAPTSITSADGTSVSISLPKHGKDGKPTKQVRGRAVAPKAVKFEGVLPGTDAVVEEIEGSSRISMLIASPVAAHEFAFDLGLPRSAKARLQDDGSVLITKSDGKGAERYVAAIRTPYALDAAGKTVQTRFALAGDTLIQTVTPAVGTKYPIMADPWLGKDLISSASWVYHSGDGWTLQVTPTGWQRTWNGYWPGSAGWDELYDKYRNRGLNTNLGGMRDQYICHVQFATGKSTYNLDEWRPDVSYVDTVNSRCNPGGSRIFD